MEDRVIAKLAGRLVSLSLAVLGLVLMATPLALWVAWSETVFFIILLTGGVAAAFYCFLVEYEPPPGPQPSGPPYHRLEAWTDRMIARVQRLHPLVHRVRRALGTRLNAAMYRLRRFLYVQRDWF